MSLLAHYVDTPLGGMMAVHTDAGLCLLEFRDKPALEVEIKEIQKHRPGDMVFAANHQTEQLDHQLAQYFSGTRKNFDLPLDLIGTAFQRTIWGLLLDIPYGETMSYKEQSLKYGDVHSVRAVAHANAKNKVSIVVPCHRVIGSNGKLVGYAGGIERKSKLLGHEKNRARAGGCVDALPMGLC